MTFNINELKTFSVGSLLLLRVGGRSAGNYSCSSHKSNTATVSINVVDGELFELVSNKYYCWHQLLVTTQIIQITKIWFAL